MTVDPNSKVSAITNFSLNRKVTVFVLFLSILVVGMVAAMGIPLELLPRGFEDQSLSVRVPWQDSPTQEVLDKITLPLEEEISTVKGLNTMGSFSRTGQSYVWLSFKQGTDMDVAYRETKDRVERAKALFPDGADRVYINKDDSSGVPVAVIGMAIDPSLTRYYDLVQKEVVLPLSRIDGVASVSKDGLEEKEIIIEVDRNKAESAGLNIYDLSQKLGDDNFTMASGNVRSHGKKFLLRSVATYDDLTALENRLVSPNVRLKDIARIRYEEAEKRYRVRVNSKPAAAIIVFKEGEANTVEVSRKLKTALEEMADNPRLATVQLEMLFNQGQLVEESLTNLLDNGLVGGVFAALVLFLFLRRFRLTAIITLSIPLSLLIALGAMFFIGETLNILSILGLVVCVGLLVDNSVVVAENIHRLHKDGLPRRQACVQGAGEIALAIITATMTTVIVFMPAFLIDGQAQFFLMRLALPITVSLVASLFIALVFIPLCVYITLPTRQKSEKPTLFRKAHDAVNAVLRIAYDLTFEKLNHLYSRILGFFLRHRFDMILFLILVFIGSIFIMQEHVDVVENQEEDKGGVQIGVRMTSTHNFEKSSEFFNELEKIMEENQKEMHLDGYLLVNHHRGGRIEAWLSDKTKETMTARDVLQKIKETLPERAGIEYSTGEENQQSTKEKRHVYQVYLQGEESGKLETVTKDISGLFLEVDGVIGLQKGQDETPNELGLEIDRDRATAGGVNPQVIAGVVGYALRGSPLPRYNDEGREVPVRIRFEEEDRESLNELANFSVPTDTGEFLPVSALTHTRMLNSPQGIFRRDKKISHSMTFELEEENLKETIDRLNLVKAGIDLPEGVSFFSGFQNRDDSKQELIFALLTAIVFIYLLIGFLFESFILPLSIITTIPLAFIGVVFAHFVTGKDLDILGMVGLVLLVGVVVNNGIVLVDYVNRLRATGLERTKSLVLASERRFRPIVMTALTTIIGMVPLTVSEANSMGLSYKSFGLTLIGGMTIATFLTLLVVPVFYTLFDDLRMLMGRLVKRLISGSKDSRVKQSVAATAIVTETD